MIRKVLGVYQDVLWVWIDNSRLVSLNIQTGTVLSSHRIPDLDPVLSNRNFLFPYFDEKKGVIAFLEHHYYVEFDLLTQQVLLLKSFVTSNPDADWNFSINTFTDDYVYFTARRGPDRSSPSHLGVFNRKRLQVEWSQDLELWKTDPYCFLNQPPQFAANKLYALDSKGTLHIFEKLENI